MCIFRPNDSRLSGKPMRSYAIEESNAKLMAVGLKQVQEVNN